MKHLTIRVPDYQHRLLKHFAVEHSTTLSELFRDAAYQFYEDRTGTDINQSINQSTSDTTTKQEIGYERSSYKEEDKQNT